ncbi:MAG: hypothetical protein WCI53_12730 [Bacteroidota bacterium]
MSDHLFKGDSTFSNHGTSQGIIPRFYLQMIDMAQFAFDKEGVEERLQNYLDKNISDFTDFYDLFTELKTLYIDYRDGLKNGKYYSIDNKVSFKQDRSNELTLKKKIKDFFIQGRLVIYNFGKSGVINDGEFILNNFLIVKDGNFQKSKESCINSSAGNKYKFLIEIIEKAREDFLSEFNQTRANFEHQNLQIEDFKVQVLNSQIEVIEPILGNMNLLTKIDYFYEQILDLIEILMVFFYGIQAHEKTNGFMTLFRREEFDYSNMNYRYVVMPNMYGSGLTKLIV